MGGFIGNASSETIDTCYASGIVNYTGSSSNFGGFTGSYSNSLQNCYYNSANSTGLNYGTAISLSDMQNQSIMTANGFTTAKGWKYESGKTPQLNYSISINAGGKTLMMDLILPSTPFNVQ